MMMSFVPKNPHFFKPVLPNFKHGLLIPISFVKRYLKGKKLEYVELKRGNRKWRVKIKNERVLVEEGWSKFVEDNKVEVGDFLVFRHEGNLVFKVLIFGPSTLLKPFSSFPSNPLPPPPPLHVKQEKAVFDDDDDDDHDDDDVNTSTQSPQLPKSAGKHKFHEFSEDKLLGNSSSRNITHGGGHPYFSSTLSLYTISKSVLYIPMKFARTNGLANRKCEMILKDEKGRSWTLMLKHTKTHVSISKGFHHFIAANGLKQGDPFIITLLHNGNLPLMNFIRLKKIPKKKQCNKFGFEEGKVTSTTTHDHGGSGGHPYFSSTLKPSHIYLSLLNVPMEFARSNGLTNRDCEMIMIDENGRSLTMRLKHNGSHVSIFSKGFRDFLASNGLKEGDSYIVHLLHNGNIPIMNFLCTRAQKIGKYVPGKEHTKREIKFT